MKPASSNHTASPGRVVRRRRSSSPSYRKSQTSEELTQANVTAIAELEKAELSHRSLSDRISDSIARFCGGMAFVWVHVIGFGAWILANTLPGLKPFDPFPFTFLTLVVSLEAIFLSTFILISQNADKVLTERRNHLDLQINLLAEQENTKMLALLGRIAEKLEITVSDDPTLEVLEEATRPDKLAEQIDTVAARTTKPHNASAKS